jgi:hypothetical protein
LNVARANPTGKRHELTIQPFGPETEGVPIMDMTGRQLEAALRHYPIGSVWGDFLRIVLRAFRAAGGTPSNRVASRVNLTSHGLLTLVRDAPPPDEAS